MTTTTLKATHRGTCQACGRAQAHFKGTIAKHGYTVDWGYFNGVCAGAEQLPLEQDKAFAERIINDLRTIIAPRADKLAADLLAGTVQPDWAKRVRGTLYACKREELQDNEAALCVQRAIRNAENNASGARAHAVTLEKLIVARHGQPLMPIVLHKELQAGMRIQIGGKKGKIFEVVEIKRQVARGCGPYMNGKVLPHAIFKRSNGEGTFAVPTQTIRQAAIMEGGAA